MRPSRGRSSASAPASSRRSCSRARSQVHAPAPHDPRRGPRRPARGLSRLLRASASGVGDAAFVAASPELLVRREGQRASTLALAGSTRRSADPAVDDHLGEQLLRSAKDREEQAIVARRIERALRPHAVWVAAAPRAGARADGQHPAPGHADPRAARRADRRGRARRAAAPDARPSAASRSSAPQPLIPALEGLDRGWYAGPGRLDRRGRGRRVLRRAALRAAARAGRALLRRRRRRARLGPGGRAGRDRGQARGAAAGARGLSAPQVSAAATAAHTRRCSATFAARSVRTSTIVVPVAVERTRQRGAKPAASATSSCSAPKSAAACAKSSPVRRGDVLLEHVAPRRRRGGSRRCRRRRC